MSKKNKKGKKGDEEMEEMIRDQLKLDVEILENNIHLEEERQKNADKKYNELLENTANENKTIENERGSNIKDINKKSENLRQDENTYSKKIDELKEEIRKLDIDIDDLEKKIIEKRKLYEDEEQGKDEAIQNQRELFQQMTVRFQHILENTANKLQERVKMGGV